MSTGALSIVATPIGNLADITLRALEALKAADLIACEDTRHTKKLLDHYGIARPTTSYFEHNQIRKTDFLIRTLKDGKNVALVSDAGTPGISDPGFYIIREALKSGIPITHIPGPSAVIAALVLSGMPTDKFAFEGFLSHKSGTRKNQLKKLKGQERTLVFYESPHRLLKTLEDIKEIFGNIHIACLRELTKKFEEVVRDDVSAVIQHFSGKKVLGEFIIVLDPHQSRHCEPAAGGRSNLGNTCN